MADFAIPTQALAEHCRATAQLIADVQSIAARAFANPATRPMAMQLQTALLSAFPELARHHPGKAAA